MVRNYVTVALRRLYRNQATSLINLGGLAVGFAAVILIGLFVLHETSYNRWLPGAGQIYKAEFTETEPGHEPLASAMTPAPLAAALVKDYTDIALTTRLKTKIYTVRRGPDQFKENVYFVDPNFFDVFDLPVADGNRDAVLAGMDAIAISERLALKYFGTMNPIGQVLNIGGKSDKRIVAILRDTPQNSHMMIDMLTRVADGKAGLLSFRDNWGSDQVHTYLKVKAGFDPVAIENDNRAFVERNITLTWTDLPPADLHRYNYMPIRDLYLYSDKDNHETAIGNIDTVVTFSLVACLVLLLAMINFSNLSTAQALRCAREVGLRKVHGASRKQIVVQFIGEAVALTLFAFVIAMATVEIVLPTFSVFIGKEIGMASVVTFSHMAVFFSLVLLTGILAGIYPAIIVSGYKPAAILTANNSGYEGPLWFRNSLVIVQFAISIALIAATAIIYRQTDYVRSLDLGFDPAGMLSVSVWEKEAKAGLPAFKAGLENMYGVHAVAAVSTALPGAPHGLGVFMREGSSRDTAKSITQIWSDANFFTAMGLRPLVGRVFEENRQVDYRSVPDDERLPVTRGAVLNLAAASMLGFTNAEQALGQKLIVPTEKRPTEINIIGVVPDINMGSLHKKVQPTVFFVSDGALPYLLIKVSPEMQAALLPEMETLWQNHISGAVLSVTPLESAYDALYLQTDREAVIFMLFAAFAILVACLGLYGLAAYTAQRKTKEIGIRKVVGATVVDIVALLTWRFSKLVLIAAPIGVIGAAYGMQEWLGNFAYRISLVGNMWVFLLAASVAFVIAWLTVGGNAAKVARSNPIMALRNE